MSDRPTFRIPVEYQDTPDLGGMFQGCQVKPCQPQHVVLDGCKDIPLVARELEIEVVDLGLIHGFEHVVRELEALGLRPLIYPELTSFVRAVPNPEVKLKDGLYASGFAAAGCYIQHHTWKHHPSYQSDYYSGYLELAWPGGFGYQEGSKIVYDCFLATRKEA